jgi:hypothetical protein
VTASFEPFEPPVRHLSAKTPDRPTTVIAEAVGWTESDVDPRGR